MPTNINKKTGKMVEFEGKQFDLKKRAFAYFSYTYRVSKSSAAFLCLSLPVFGSLPV